ncbi:MAG: hypothetical protein IJT91_00850 [Clostridia bacterium]|nr:hypothetical protein [Clostridia bacterium]
MTVKKAINELDSLREGNTYSTDTLRSWLAELENTIRVELYETHCISDYVFDDDDDMPDDKELLCPPGFEHLYTDYLVMKTDLNNGDMDVYNNEAILFNRRFAQMSDYINRTEEPAGANSLHV